MILIGEISKKKIHDYMFGDSIIKDLWWSKNLPSLFKIWFGEQKSIKGILTLRKISHVPINIILVIQSEENILIWCFKI